MLDSKALGDWLWDAACKIRGPVDAPKFKDYILPLVFLKRLSDVFEDEVDRLKEEIPGINMKLVEEAHQRDQPLVRFYIPPEARWDATLEETVPAEVFKSEVSVWAERIGVRPKEVHIRPMTRKWASCSSTGRLTFSCDLLIQPASVRAEAIVHELLHLKIQNHGPLFRALLRAYLVEGRR